MLWPDDLFSLLVYILLAIIVCILLCLYWSVLLSRALNFRIFLSIDVLRFASLTTSISFVQVNIKLHAWYFEITCKVLYPAVQSDSFVRTFNTGIYVRDGNSSIDINISAETSVYHSQANKHDLCGIICNSEKHDYNSRHASQLVPCDHFCHYFFSILWKMTSRKRVPRFDTDFLPASSDWKSNIWISINWWMSCNPELRLPCFQTHTASITLMSHLTSKYKVVCGREY